MILLLLLLSLLLSNVFIYFTSPLQFILLSCFPFRPPPPPHPLLFCFCSERGWPPMGISKAYNINLRQIYSFPCIMTGQGKPVLVIASQKLLNEWETLHVPTARFLEVEQTTQLSHKCRGTGPVPWDSFVFGSNSVITYELKLVVSVSFLVSCVVPNPPGSHNFSSSLHQGSLSSA